jgi:hypothetical protein
MGCPPLPDRFPMTIYFYKVGDPYGCFSNFSPHWIVVDGVDWPTVEHFYQAQKFVGTESAAVIDRIRSALTASEAAALGRNPAHQLRSDWNRVKRSIMAQGVWVKFSSHPELAQVLLSTGNEELIEDSPTDYYWGCGADRTGKNELGKVLMETRDQLRENLALSRSFL